jgi:bifunctional non-homologous end joining protein LigD
MAVKKSGTKSAAQEVDEQLARYRAMRDFAMTAEPSGAADKKSKVEEDALPFVIQKHAATRLHYDFRLGWLGVLKSWAVTKGPSYFPGDKRLAVQVEDHPIEYGGFEGTIPKGQYGGGTVMVWDQGTWEPHVDVDEGLQKGSLKFSLHGQKLHGKWTLVRMGGRAAHESKPNWLLIKEHDEYERAANEMPITEEAPNSAITGRDIDAIAKAEDHVWQSHAAKQRETAPNRSRLTRKLLQASDESQNTAPDRESLLKEIPRESLPDFVLPQLATQIDAPPPGDRWLHELKLDGYRIQVRIEQPQPNTPRKVSLHTRNGLDWTHRMPDIAREAARLRVNSALLDGEVVVLDESGKTSFAELQAAFEGKKKHLTYFAFDLLHLDGHNLRTLSLMRRKEFLEGLIGEIGENDILRYSQHVRGEGAQMFANACKLGAEGVVSKLFEVPHASGRSKEWLKAKCVHEQEFVVGGFTLPSKGGVGIGALLLGYYENGKLIYAGRSGTGFTQAMRVQLRKKLEDLTQKTKAFAEVPAEYAKDAIWVHPELVVEVHFASWTSDGLVRQAAFDGVREDKPAEEVVREEELLVAKHARKGIKTTSTNDHSDAPDISTSVADTKETPPEVRLTHPEKILDAETKLTKRQLADYYSAVAEVMLSHIAARPLSLVRCPEGTGEPCFFQKHIGMGLPKGIDSIPVKSKSGGAAEQYITIAKREGLVGLAQMGVLEIHPWGSRNESLENPDRLIFDLDPDEAITWKRLVASAFEVRDLLKQLGLESFVKSTGGKGLHIVAPINPERSWTEIKEFAHHFVQMMENANQQLYLIKMTKAARKDRIFLDYLRNERGATAVAPYSPRARSGVRVAMPLSWRELKQGERPEFSVVNFAQWKARLKRDPWAEMETLKQSISDDAIRVVDEFRGNQKSAS